MRGSPVDRRVEEAGVDPPDPRANAGEARPSGAARRESATAPLPVWGALLLAAIAAGLVARGASQAAGQGIVAGFLLAGAAAAWVERRAPRRDSLSLRAWRPGKGARFVPSLPLLAALAAWAVLSAALSGDLRRAASTVTMLTGVGVVLVLSSRLGAASRRTAVTTLTVVGVIVAASGWIGVAWRVSPLVTGAGAFRGAGLLTYTNATAAILVPLVLLALGTLIERRGAGTWTLAASLMLVGLGATGSQGGLVALALGLVVLAAGLGGGPTFRAAAPPLLGAAVALAGLLPSMPADSQRQPLLALVSLGAGLTLAGALSKVSVGKLLVSSAAGCLVGSLGLTIGPTSEGVDAIALTKADSGWSGRAEMARDALAVATHHPLAGAGPMASRLDWVSEDGRVLTTRYVHNEYLQVLADLGGVGLVLLLALLLTLARSVARGRSYSPSRAIWIAGVAGLAAFAVHSAVDVLWHVPALPLCLALLVGVSMPPVAEDG